MTFTELRDLITRTIDAHPHMGPLTVRITDDDDHVQTPTGKVRIEQEDGAVYAVLPTTDA